MRTILPSSRRALSSIAVFDDSFADFKGGFVFNSDDDGGRFCIISEVFSRRQFLNEYSLIGTYFGK